MKILVVLCLAAALAFAAEPAEGHQDYSEINELLSQRDCKGKNCVQHCRLGTRGVCINGKCVCLPGRGMALLTQEPFTEATDQLVEPETAELDELEPRNCIPDNCRYSCNIIGGKGECSQDRCICHFPRPLALETQDLSTPVETGLDEVEPPKCFPETCDYFCKVVGAQGQCVYTQCVCIYPKQTLEDLSTPIEESVETGLDAGTPRACNLISCNLECRMKGRVGGVCYYNECQCGGPRLF